MNCFGMEKKSSDGLKGASNVPAWAKRAIWYQIFPERFRNGDPSNDPKGEDLDGSWPHQVTNGWQVSNWTGDWYKKQSWEESDGNDFYFHVQQRRYGGDLQGIIDKLDYLKDLGVNALYLNPIFESPSLHKYDPTLYHHVDNNFGPDPEGDKALWAKENPADPQTWQWSSADKLFLNLLKEAHKRGIRVIIDGVFNHVGMTFWAFKDVEKNQQRSVFKDWFKVKRWDNPSTPNNEFEYEGWNGVRELAEVKKDSSGIAPGFRDHIRAIVQRWMDPNGDGNPEDGIDGWRLDVAEKVPIPFWREFRQWVRAINPDAYIVGEVWWEDWKNDKMFNAASWLQGDVFDAVMNYRWAREVFRYFGSDKTKISTSKFTKSLQGLLRDYPTDINYVMLNLYDSHDTDRLGSHIANSELPYKKGVVLTDNKKYKIRKPNADELKTQRLMALFQMTYLGAPMIYYGDEAGMWGGDDPDCRKPMLWPDLQYENERSHPFGGTRPNDENKFNDELFQWYARLTHIRTSHPALQTGTCEFLRTDDSKDVLAYVRSEGQSQVLVVMNNSHSSHEVTLRLPAAIKTHRWKGLLDQADVSSAQGTLTLTLLPKSGNILESAQE
ncbi:MAG: alpha-glucosidase C-terminal domain-containing protein [Ignavibacteriales bacterium]|nr:alpha-glucosidase C-terminal domain-containing protein [Ignavibacteriales bacterium]